MAAPRPDLLITRAQSKHLDVLRGLAAQLVLVQHALGRCFPGTGYDEYGLGALGVLTFFILSGFLITDSIASRVRQHRFTLTEFLVSRFARIYTPYLPAVALVALLDAVSSRLPAYEYAADYNWQTAVANVAMLQDFPVFQILRRLHVPDQPWFFKTFGSGRQFWTVSIEWWIYVCAGLATALALRPRPIPAFWPVLLAVAAVEPLYHFVGGPGDCLTLAWLLGAAAALLHRRFALGGTAWRFPDRGLALCWSVVTLMAGVRLFFTHGRVYDPEFALLLTAVILLPLARYRTGHTPLLGRLGLDRLSFNSYSLYLTHGSLVVLATALAPTLLSGWRGMALIVLGANLFAVVFAYVFERPHRQVRAALLRWLAPLPR